MFRGAVPRFYGKIMDDSQIPWWLIVCMGIVTGGMAVWQSSRCHFQWRTGGGLLALLFLAILAVAMGGDPRGGPMKPWRFADVVIVGLSVISVVATALLAGRPPLHGQLAWFATMSLANAGICFVTGARAIAVGLLIVGLAAAGMLLLKHRTFASIDLWPVPLPQDDGEAPTVNWLAGLTGLALALILVGSNYYAQRAESTRATLTRRHSALPSRSRVRTLLNIQPDHERSLGLLDQLTGRRADVVVLLAVLAFVSLAAWKSTPSPPRVADNPLDGQEPLDPVGNS